MEIKDKDLQELKISDIFEKYSDKRIFIHTPDGMQEMGNFFIKSRECVEISTNKRKDKVSLDHLFLSKDGWIFAKDSINKEVLTVDGFEKIERR